jgi:hypothetical protein
LTAIIALDDKADFEIADGHMSVSTDEISGITSLEKIKPVLKDVPSMSGIMQYPHCPERIFCSQRQRFTVDGETNNLPHASSFPEERKIRPECSESPRRAEPEGHSNEDEDSVLTVSGTLGISPLSIQLLFPAGEIGQKSLPDIRLIHLPRNCGPRSSFCFFLKPLMGKRQKNNL